MGFAFRSRPAHQASSDLDRTGLNGDRGAALSELAAEINGLVHDEGESVGRLLRYLEDTGDSSIDLLGVPDEDRAVRIIRLSLDPQTNPEGFSVHYFNGVSGEEVKLPLTGDSLGRFKGALTVDEVRNALTMHSEGLP